MYMESSRFKRLHEELSKVPKSNGPGKIIVLNGTSSAGKTTIAKLLQDSLYEKGLGVYLYISIDGFQDSLPKGVKDQPENLVKELPQIVYAYSSVITSACVSGVNIIADMVFTEINWTHDFLYKAKELNTLYVGVKCSLEKTIQREIVRGDRVIGLAEYQYERVHRDIDYDLVVDTTNIEPRVNVLKILSILKVKKFKKENKFLKL